MPIYLQLFNTVLKSGFMPQTWSYGLITPMFKSGSKSSRPCFTLRTLIDKYVNCHKTKVYACFADLKCGPKWEKCIPVSDQNGVKPYPMSENLCCLTVIL